MITLDECSNVASALLLKQQDEYSYNYYVNSVGLSRTLELYGVNKEKYKKRLTDKSKEYNRINSDFNGIIQELESFGKSLQEFIKLSAGKLRNIDKNNGSTEDFNMTLKSVTDLKSKYMDVITSKQKAIKEKYDLLQKQTKMEKDMNGLGSGGNGNSDVGILSLAKNITSGTNPIFGGVTSGKYDGVVASTNNLAPSPQEQEDIKKKEDTNESIIQKYSGASQSSTFALNGEPNNRHKILERLSSRNDSNDYSTLVTKYGKDAIQYTYKLNPENGFGYLEYRTPDEHVGIRRLPVSNFVKPVDFDNMIITDGADMPYDVQLVDSIPTDVEEEWLKIVDKVNEYGVIKK